jgi:hypothetical protein
MPLTQFQADVFRIISRNRNPDSYVAGATLIHRNASSPRYSRDIDLFHDALEAVAASAKADADSLQKAKYQVEFSIQTDTFQRAVVSRDGESVRLEWAADSAFRFFPLVQDDLLGFRLHDADSATNKVLAAVGRVQIRDVVDLLYLGVTYISLGAAIWAACGKDEGWTAELILQELRRNGRYNPATVEGLDLTKPIDPKALKAEWLAALDGAEASIRSFPDLTRGFLFLDPTGEPVRSPLFSPDWTAHRGSVKGAWPKLVQE